MVENCYVITQKQKIHTKNIFYDKYKQEVTNSESEKWLRFRVSDMKQQAAQKEQSFRILAQKLK